MRTPGSHGRARGVASTVQPSKLCDLFQVIHSPTVTCTTPAILHSYPADMTRQPPSPLDPTVTDRIRGLVQPDWLHTTRTRRIAAALLVLLAAAAALRPDPAGQRSPTLIATRDLAPGAALGPDDVRVVYQITGSRPDGALDDPAAVLGATPGGAIRRGEVLTDVRLLGSRLAAAGAGPDARMVPIRLSDGAVADLIRAGDVVDVLAARDDTDGPAPRVLAADAVVVLIPPAPAQAGADGRIVLVALPAAAAQLVATVSLTDALTVTMH